MIDLSIIIINYNTKKLLEGCLESIKKYTTGISYEVLVFDNASKDGSKEYLKKIEKLDKHVRTVFNEKNIGFGGGNNYLLRKAKGKYILLLNSDTYLTKNIFSEMLSWMDAHPKAGIVTSALKNQDGSYQGTGGYFPTLTRVGALMLFLDDVPFVNKFVKPFHPMRNNLPFSKGTSFYTKERRIDWVTGAFFLMRKDVYEDVGDFDDDYFMYVEEVDYCYRAQEYGWQVYYLPRWEIVHLGGASSGKSFPIISEYEGLKTFYKKHMPGWQLRILTVLLKLGAALRIVILGTLKGKDYARIYKEAYKKA